MNESDNKLRVNIMIREEQREYLAQVAEENQTSVSEIIRELIDEKRKRDQTQRLADAATALAEEYRNNEDLTAFTALDHEDMQ
jgi:predicted CopG family antitoxin